MKSVLKYLLAALFFGALFACAEEKRDVSGEWQTNWEEAKAQAAKEGKDLLVDFTGSDWCGWCIKLHDEVFSKEEFSAYAKDKFILVELDFPSNKEQSAEVKAQNQKLQAEYSVQGFPTIFLMDSEGRPYAKTGYQAGGPKAYNKHLDSYREMNAQRKSLLSEASKLKGEAKALKLAEALQPVMAFASFYSKDFKEIEKLDPSDKTGFKSYGKISSLEKEIVKNLQSGNGKVAEKMLTDFLETENLSGENLQKTLFMKLFFLSTDGEENLLKAQKVVDEIIAIDASTATAKKCTEIKSFITQQLSK